jgi:hypothetical protein
LPRAAAGHLGNFRERRLDAGQRFARPTTRSIDQPACQALRIIEQNLEQMFGGELLVAFAQGQ